MVTLSDIREAARRLRPILPPTPCTPALRLGQALGCELYLKLENLQMTGSFKARGALNRMLRLGPQERSAGVIAASAGNHAQGLAFAAQRLGVPACIVMPETTPLAKQRGTAAFGAEVVLHGSGYDEAYARAVEIQAERGATFVHAFNDPDVIAGQGSVGLELLEQLEAFDVAVVPVGGGGLIAGTATALGESRPGVRVVGVQSARIPGMKASLEAGEILTLASAGTIADGIAVARVGTHTFPLVRRHVKQVVTVNDEEIARAIMVLLEEEKLLAEGAGAVGLAALQSGLVPDVEGRRVVVVVSGGNIDMIALTKIIERGLEEDGRLAVVRVVAPDVAGSIADLARLIADRRANIIHIAHNRHAAEVGLREAEVEFTLETRGRDHAEEICTAMAQRGYRLRTP